MRRYGLTRRTRLHVAAPAPRSGRGASAAPAFRLQPAAFRPDDPAAPSPGTAGVASGQAAWQGESGRPERGSGRPPVAAFSPAGLRACRGCNAPARARPPRSRVGPGPRRAGGGRSRRPGRSAPGSSRASGGTRRGSSRRTCVPRAGLETPGHPTGEPHPSPDPQETRRVAREKARASRATRPSDRSTGFRCSPASADSWPWSLGSATSWRWGSTSRRRAAHRWPSPLSSRPRGSSWASSSWRWPAQRSGRRRPGSRLA